MSAESVIKRAAFARPSLMGRARFRLVRFMRQARVDLSEQVLGRDEFVIRLGIIKTPGPPTALLMLHQSMGNTPALGIEVYDGHSFVQLIE